MRMKQMNHEEEVMFMSKMNEVACFIRDIDEGDIFDLMKEIYEIAGIEKIIDIKLMAKEVFDLS